MLGNQDQRLHGHETTRTRGVGGVSTVDGMGTSIGTSIGRRETLADGRQLVRDLQLLLAERQQLVVTLRQAAASGDASTADLAEGLAHLTARHDALLDRLASAVPPAGTPFRRKLPAA